jgi:preprotein translocase subunit SecE
MGKDKAPGGGWWELAQEFLRFDLYKRSQGKIVRQATGGVVALGFALAAWRMHEYLHAYMGERTAALAYAIPTVVLLLGLWIAYRLVNVPSFADFLIAVEAEMNKVSWPARTELVRASIVVIVLMFGLALVLFGYDYVWNFLLSRVLRITIV